MGGYITKLLIALVLFGTIISFTTYLMTSLGNEYGREVDSAYSSQFSEVNSDIRQIQVESIEIEKGSTLDADSQDVAQLEGILSAGRKQADSDLTATSVLKDIQDFIPFADFVFVSIATIIGILSIGAVFSYIRGRWA